MPASRRDNGIDTDAAVRSRSIISWRMASAQAVETDSTVRIIVSSAERAGVGAAGAGGVAGTGRVVTKGKGADDFAAANGSGAGAVGLGAAGAWAMEVVGLI